MTPLLALKTWYQIPVTPLLALKTLYPWVSNPREYQITVTAEVGAPEVVPGGCDLTVEAGEPEVV